MKKSVWELLWSSFQEVQTFWYGFLGFLLTIVFSVVTGKVLIPLYWFVAIISVMSLAIATLFRALDRVFNDYKHLRKPEILSVQIDKKNNFIVCLFENSDLFATDLGVSFYYVDEYSFEVLIGVGYVKTVQNNGKIQVVINYPDPAYQDIVTRLGNSDRQVIEKIFIRLGIPRNFNQP
jgi:hypothetical protein